MTNKTDGLTRSDMRPFTDLTNFERMSPATRAILKRAASRGAANSTPDAFVEVGQDWLMVPSKRGKRQVVITATRAFRL